MATFSQTIFSDAFSWMKSFVFWSQFHWSLFLRVQLTITSIDLDNGLALYRQQAIIWTNADLIYWRIYICGTRGRWVEIAVNALWPEEKWQNIFQIKFQMHFSEWKYHNFNYILLMYDAKHLVDDKSALVQVMAWCRRGNKPLPDRMPKSMTSYGITRPQNAWCNSNFLKWLLIGWRPIRNYFRKLRSRSSNFYKQTAQWHQRLVADSGNS